jgi:hypothetical protein
MPLSAFTRIAGHDFTDGLRCRCGQSWLNIRNTQKSEIGDPRIAHVGLLNAAEYAEIERRRNAEDAAMQAAMQAVTGAKPQAAAGEDEAHEAADDQVLF